MSGLSIQTRLRLRQNERCPIKGLVKAAWDLGRAYFHHEDYVARETVAERVH
jgi:hypothetical protein